MLKSIFLLYSRFYFLINRSCVSKKGNEKIEIDIYSIIIDQFITNLILN